MTEKYRIKAAVYHSFCVEASSEEDAREVAIQEVDWQDHVTDCDFEIELEDSND